MMNDTSDMGAMGDEDTMSPQADAPKPQQDSDEPVSIFLSKASLPADKKYKEGDKITLTVESIDPETGDLEACIYSDGEDNHEQYGESPSLANFDAAMPEKE